METALYFDKYIFISESGLAGKLLSGNPKGFLINESNKYVKPISLLNKLYANDKN